MIVKLKPNKDYRLLFEGIEDHVFVGVKDTLYESVVELEDEIDEQLPWGWQINEMEDKKGYVELELQYYSCIEGDMCDASCGSFAWIKAYLADDQKGWWKNVLIGEGNA